MQSKVLNRIPGLADALMRHQVRKATMRPNFSPKIAEPTRPSPKTNLKTSDVIADVLASFGGPLRNKNIILLAEFMFRTSIPRTRFGTLRKEGVQKVLLHDAVLENLCPLPAISTLTLRPIEGYLCSSAWDLEKRLVSPQTEGLQHARFINALIDLHDGQGRNDHQLQRMLGTLGLNLFGNEFLKENIEVQCENLRRYSSELIRSYESLERTNIDEAIGKLNHLIKNHQESHLWHLLGLPAQIDPS